MERVRVCPDRHGVGRATSQALANLVACVMRWIGNPFGRHSSSYCYAYMTASFQSHAMAPLLTRKHVPFLCSGPRRPLGGVPITDPSTRESIRSRCKTTSGNG